MPWTFAHPAAILLFRRVGSWSLPLSGLVVGSLAPDVGYYAGCFALATQAHTAGGALLLCVPTGCGVVLLLRWLRSLLIAPLPDPHRMALERLSVPSLSSPGHALRMVAAVSVGAMTHVVWDAFTHAGGAMVAALAPLRAELFAIGGRHVAVYNVLQHASTLGGVAALGLAYVRWLHRTVGVEACLQRRALRAHAPLAVAAVASVLIGFGLAMHEVKAQGGASAAVFRSALHATVAFSLAYALLGLRAVLRRKRSEGRGGRG